MFSLTAVAVAVTVDATTRRDATLRLSTCFDRIRCRRCLCFAFLGLCSGFASLCYCASGVAEAAAEEFRQIVEQSKHATVPRVRCPVCYPTYALLLHTHTHAHNSRAACCFRLSAAVAVSADVAVTVAVALPAIILTVARVKHSVIVLRFAVQVLRSQPEHPSIQHGYQFRSRPS